MASAQYKHYEAQLCSDNQGELKMMKRNATANATTTATQLPTNYTKYGLLDTSTGKIFLFSHVIERLNMTLGQFGYEVSAILESIDALKALAQLEKAIDERNNSTSEDAFYDLV